MSFAARRDSGPSIVDIPLKPLQPCSGTYQAYLRRLPAHLDHAIRHAEDNGYVLGVKLVRGAYHLQETKKWKDEGRGKFGKDPIWDE